MFEKHRYIQYFVTFLVMLHCVMGGHVYCCVHFHELAHVTGNVDEKPSSCCCGNHHGESSPAPDQDRTAPCDDGHGCIGSQPVLAEARAAQDDLAVDLFSFISWTLPVCVDAEGLPFDFQRPEPLQTFAPNIRLHLLFGSLLI